MPRYASPANTAHQARQRRYRKRLQDLGRPEASAVDVAVAEAVARLVEGASRDASADKSVFRRLLSDSLDLLVSRGYSPAAAKTSLIRRLGRFDPSAAIAAREQSS